MSIETIANIELLGFYRNLHKWTILFWIAIIVFEIWAFNSWGSCKSTKMAVKFAKKGICDSFLSKPLFSANWMWKGSKVPKAYYGSLNVLKKLAKQNRLDNFFHVRGLSIEKHHINTRSISTGPGHGAQSRFSGLESTTAQCHG